MKAFKFLVAALSLAAGSLVAQAETITMASTTSTEQSGLFAHLLPAFRQASGIDVKVVAVGTGQAIDMARRGDADVLFVHDAAAEEKFVAEGFAEKRYAVMYNDFVLVGPRSDPAAAKGKDIAAALKKVAAINAPFVSRGDKSGTDAAERRLWAQAGVGEAGQPLPNDRKGTGYKECGCGMGPALNMAASSAAYVLADRGTWLSFRNRAGLAILVEGDKRLFNQYGVMVVSPSKFPQLNSAGAQKFVDWVISPAGQSTIASYKIGGEQLFFPNAGSQ
ncbi:MULTISPECIES: substrate-binding domain-containing protein [unclassified Variovorax]|uniref:substrate-binding domain-containing protein n=1 Tax=unclassified Variovorax TaxID=663243 RepID=UPI00076D9CB4|nr:MULTISPECIES: substrate-binding domain-containing protein [unclassified Variovorax]KWT82536.1 ABC-type tungstate transport system, periplasmic binding protein [Variovorax sp. WDL1]PNG55705.1 Tungstate-binding protein TupA [Variovorax sp. B4]PNG57129.1 Tungstate-binding protein TupA [Variovorax sp. B2]VTV10560.1 ABC-type thiamine transport system, periplasmic component [Variovorax sp. WDL1]